MPKNKIDDLRNHLFATLEDLRDKDKPMEIARARAIADVASVLVASAKVEVDLLKVTGRRRGSGFMPDAELPAAPSTASQTGISPVDHARPRALRGV
jgi:hypothetical protein